MLFNVAVALIVAWLLGVFGLYHLNQYVQGGFLLVGLMLLMLAFLRDRDAVVHRGPGGPLDKP